MLVCESPSKWIKLIILHHALDGHHLSAIWKDVSDHLINNCGDTAEAVPDIREENKLWALVAPVGPNSILG